MVKSDKERNKGMDKVSKFHEIFLEIESAILNQTYKSGELLPSENELTKKYNVSRETIRKALTLLLENGYIQKKQGKGSIVLDVKRFNFPISGLTSYKELQDSQSIGSQTILIENRIASIPKHIAEFLKVSEATQVHTVIRARKLNDEVVILDKDYLLTSVIEELPDEEAENSLYHYIEHKLGLKIGYARKEFTVEPVTEEDRSLMSLHGDHHVVVTRSDVHLEDTRLFQYTESRHRLDKFRFVDFARRRGPQAY
ncbi:GntR family transcriptional regulator [Marinilactibacillus psychrotolerans]|uniref:Trehalose operon repressor n=2 Tax=Marinilactibacillus psychrotolerans TaxID=191770 RepID=A0AAV3WRG4_9LACT|nr:trehalose operon repressor [Marinilactibacillus psychrotolerans]GEQ34095.1 GntR family transcriptional regulator [Marinilactibacillus psychrotolerans]GEQ35355.1 GntR family transcriptional regulator [Marinilactibacillus psychrotolerans]SDC50320.1 GntR family transcriptional regulator, trehalose operon transcriptional repressor [Marinilactibacillus psychrotolerans]SJN19935.1 Trehalose operon transcriptional repressor [Marinilactibacillus psychrotolerans 42ea]